MANNIQASITLDGKDALNTIKALEKGVKNLGTTGTKSVGSMTSAVQVFQGVVGAQAVLKALDLTARAFKQGAKDALEFGKAVAEINSIAPRTAQETLALKQQIIGLSNEFGGAAQKQARAFYNIVSAGVRGVTNQLNVLETANKAAVAGLVDIDTSARVLVASVNSYAQSGLTANEASDVLFNTVKEGITTFGELSSSIGAVAPLAAAAGVKFSELGGTLAFLTKSGISTSEAATGLRAVLTGIIKPAQEAKRAANTLGIDLSTSAIKSKGFANVLKDVIVATKGSEVELAKLFPNVRALGPIVQIAAGNFDEFVRILDSTASSAGATGAAFKTITDSAAFQFEKLTNQLRNFPTAILTNFEEPLADALKVVNEFVGSQGVLLIPRALSFVIEAFKDLADLKDDTEDFFDSVGEGASKVATFFNQLSGGAVTDVAKLSKELSTLQHELKLTNEALDSAEEGSAVEEKIKGNVAAIEKQIAAKKVQISVFQQADLADAEIVDKELKRRENRNAKILEFQNKIEAAKQKQLEQDAARREKEEAADKEAAAKQLETALEAQETKFDAIQELKAAQAELETEAEEEAKLGRDLEAQEEFLFLSQNLGKQNALRELNRISNIKSEEKRQAELKKLRAKAQKEEEAGILSIRKFEDLSNKEKIAGQKATLATISTLSQSSNSALFAIGKASSLALAGINVAEGVTKALAAFPPPYSFVAAAAVGAAGAVNIAKIASAKAPSAGSFQSGGIIEGASQTGDQLTANVNGGEAIFNRRQQQNLFNAVNDGSIGGSSASIMVNVESLTGTLPQEQIDSMIDQINDRTEFGNKQLGVA